MGECCADGLISLAFTDLTRASSALLEPCQGIFTAVQDVSSLTDQHHTPGLTTATSSASALIMLITRADDPTQTQAQLAAILGASPLGLNSPLLLLTTAPDLHQGVERWLAALPDRLPGFKQHVCSARVVCLADRWSSKAVGSYSQSALQAGLQWAAAHSPAQLQLKVCLADVSSSCHVFGQCVIIMSPVWPMCHQHVTCLANVSSACHLSGQCVISVSPVWPMCHHHVTCLVCP